jgi:Methionine biosynthesis protein MetW
MRLLNWTHDRVVHSWRVEALHPSLAPMVPEGAFVLDGGCGDGLLARRLAESRGCRMEGIDVLSHPAPHVLTTLFEGRHIPDEETIPEFSCRRPGASLAARSSSKTTHARASWRAQRCG